MAKGDLEPQHSGVILASPSDSVSACLEKMATANVGSILIVDGKQIIGILTERDLLKYWKNGQKS